MNKIAFNFAFNFINFKKSINDNIFIQIDNNLFIHCTCFYDFYSVPENIINFKILTVSIVLNSVFPEA